MSASVASKVARKYRLRRVLVMSLCTAGTGLGVTQEVLRTDVALSTDLE